VKGKLRPRRPGFGSLLVGLAAVFAWNGLWAVPAAAQEQAGASRTDSVAVLVSAYRGFDDPEFRGFDDLDEYPLRLADGFSCGWTGGRGCVRGAAPDADTAAARVLLSEVADSLGVATGSGDPGDRPPCPWGEMQDREDTGLIVGLSPPRFAGDSAQVVVSRRCWEERGDRVPRGYALGATVRLRRSEGEWKVAEVTDHWVT